MHLDSSFQTITKRSRFMFILCGWISYGYVTNSKIKFIIVVDSSNIALRENDVRTVSKMPNIVSICNRLEVTHAQNRFFSSIGTDVS